MKFIQTLINYLFSSNWNLINPSYRFSPVFYKRLTLDFLLRVLTFLPFTIAFAVLVSNGYFKDFADTMLQSGQNLYGYLTVIFVYVPLFLFFIASIISSTIGSVLKRTVFPADMESTDVSILPKSYGQAFVNSWKNLWYITLETFVIIFIAKIFIELYVIHSITFSALALVKAALVTVGTSAIVSSIISLPWFLKFRTKATEEVESNDTVIG